MTENDKFLLSGALCNLIPYIYYCALTTALVCLFPVSSVEQLYTRFYTVRIASHQSNHGYFAQKQKKNKPKTKTG